MIFFKKLSHSFLLVVLLASLWGSLFFLGKMLVAIPYFHQADWYWSVADHRKEIHWGNSLCLAVVYHEHSALPFPHKMIHTGGDRPHDDTYQRCNHSTAISYYGIGLNAMIFGLLLWFVSYWVRPQLNRFFNGGTNL